MKIYFTNLTKIKRIKVTCFSNHISAFIYLFNYSFIYSFIYLFIYLFI